MRNRSRIVGQFCAILAVSGAATGAIGLSGVAAQDSGTTDITITVTNLRNTDGVVRACMTTDEDSFPKCRGVAGAHSVTVPAQQNLTLTFENVRPGRYAIALLHDENNNNKADRALMMMPTEGFGFSRDAKVRMGPPRFRSAAFDVGSEPINQTIRMRYML